MKKTFLPLAIIVIVVGGIVGSFYWSTYHAVAALDAVALSPANYQPAALDLIKLCQSDPSFYTPNSAAYTDSNDAIWVPPSVARLHGGVSVNADRATVAWGINIYYCGWNLTRGAPTAGGRSYSWTLSFYSEDARKNRPLQTIIVAKDQRFTKTQYIGYVLAEFDRRLASQSDNRGDLATQRCLFLKDQNRLELLPAQVRKAAANYPHDWHDVLLGYLLDHAAGDKAAAGRLNRWAATATGPAAWLYAAYGFYQSGEMASGDAAVKQAIADKSSDPEWIGRDTAPIEMGMALKLYKSGNFKGCASLCDGILSSRHPNFTIRSSVQRLRGYANAVSPTHPAGTPIFGREEAVDPFRGFDLNLLYAAATPSPLPTTRP
jgi:hypothetical protein